MPRLVQFANNATSTLASGITNVATSITLATGTGSRFPSPTGSQYFMATLVNAAGTQVEVVKVTARSGDVLTVTRAQEAIAGTAATAYAFSAGDKIEARLTAGLMGGEIDRLEALYNVTVDTFTGAGSAGPFTLTSAPGSKQATLVYVGGVYQEKSTYTLSGTSLTLGDPVPTGTMVEVAYGTPLTIGTPSDGTVTTAKLASTTGSGAVVLATSPTLTTPTLGTPASGNLSNCTVDGTNAVGFINIPQNPQSVSYTLVAGDAGKHLLHPAADTTARTFTIPPNSGAGSVPFPIGTAITFVNQNGAGTLSIAITTDTMRLAGAGTTGTRTLAANGVATAIKITSTEWIISGTGLT